MRVSLNEIETRYAKALEALGLPGGLAWDAAQIVMWHDLWGLDGAERLAARLDRLDGCEALNLQVERHSGGMRVAAAGHSILAAGPGALDLLEADDGETDFAVEVRTCRDLDLAAGLAGLAAMRNVDAGIEAAVGDTRIRAAASGGDVAIQTFTVPAHEVSATGTLVLRRLRAAAGDVALTEAAFTAADLAARRAEALEAGVSVKGAAWRRIKALSARFLVAETAESRQRGAGGGSYSD